MIGSHVSELPPQQTCFCGGQYRDMTKHMKKRVHQEHIAARKIFSAPQAAKPVSPKKRAGKKRRDQRRKARHGRLVAA